MIPDQEYQDGTYAAAEAPAGPGIPGHCLVWRSQTQALDAKTRGNQHIAYAYTDVRIA